MWSCGQWRHRRLFRSSAAGNTNTPWAPGWASPLCWWWPRGWRPGCGRGLREKRAKDVGYEWHVALLRILTGVLSNVPLATLTRCRCKCQFESLVCYVIAVCYENYCHSLIGRRETFEWGCAEVSGEVVKIVCKMLNPFNIFTNPYQNVSTRTCFAVVYFDEIDALSVHWRLKLKSDRSDRDDVTSAISRAFPTLQRIAGQNRTVSLNLY